MAPEIAAVLARIDERVARRVRVELENRPVEGVALEVQRALDAKLARRLAEGRDRDRITEDVVEPAKLGRGRQRKLGPHEPQIVAVAGPQHQPMRPEAHRSRIVVGGGVADAQGFHDDSGRRGGRPRSGGNLRNAVIVPGRPIISGLQS